MMTISFIFISY